MYNEKSEGWYWCERVETLSFGGCFRGSLKKGVVGGAHEGANHFPTLAYAFCLLNESSENSKWTKVVEFCIFSEI